MRSDGRRSKDWPSISRSLISCWKFKQRVRLMAQNDQALLTRLNDSGLEFVVIGGVCVVYHGALLATFDLDVCCPFGEENVRRIESAVEDLHPVHRLTANKLPLEMTRSSFGDLKNLYLQTDLGKL